MYGACLLSLLLGEHVRHLKELLYVFSLESVPYFVVIVPSKAIGGDDPMHGTGIPEVFYLCVLEGPQDLPHLVDKHILLFHPFSCTSNLYHVRRGTVHGVPALSRGV